MRNNYKYILTLLAILFFSANSSFAQYPGGVSTGTTRGYKVDYYNGTFSSVSQFGAGSGSTTPNLTAYTNKITGTEFIPIDADYYGLEYTGTLEIPLTGNYTFNLTGDDAISLYIDGNLKISATYAAGSTVVVNLTAGDHAIKVKHYELGGAQSAALTFTATPAGSGITSPTNVDGRFVRTENAKLSAWYKATDLNVTANYNGADVDKVNSWNNVAPDYLGKGKMVYDGSGTAARSNKTDLINFNPGVYFSGDDSYSTKATIQGLSLLAATKTMFMVNDYTSNTGQSSIWMFFHGDTANGQRFGFWKSDGTGNQLGVSGTGVFNSSAYLANEPKLLSGSLSQLTGGSASNTTNPIKLSSNGNVTTTANIVSQADYDEVGLRFVSMNGAIFPEAIYYPFELNTTQQNQVNTYLALKYGITLSHDYLNTSGATVFSLSSNSGYTSRIFGIGREMTAEGLNQKQSQSQMLSTTGGGADFLTVAKGTIATSNILNTGSLADGDYLILGDNGTGTISAQTAEIPSNFSSGFTCTAARINREWKVQITGTPGGVTFQAGSVSYKFPAGAAGLSLLIDTDNDGNFLTGTPTILPAASLKDGIATFNNVTLVSGNVITFAWSVIAPGGVSNGLKLWAKADDAGLAAGSVTTWNDYSVSGNNLTNNNTVTKVANIFNYNPTLQFAGGDARYMITTSELNMNNSNTYGEFYVLKGTATSGTLWDDIITLGGNNHRWENSSNSLTTGYYGQYGPGTAQLSASGPGAPVMGDLALYGATGNGGSSVVLRGNGNILVTTNTPGNLSIPAGAKFKIGSQVNSSVSGRWNNFYCPELIVYNNYNLSNTDIDKINSYLAVKYSIPLKGGASNLLSANGTVIWSNNPTYKNDIMAIGRDDCSGLIQKQSTAYIESTTNNLRIALGTLATDNDSNKSNFTANNQFLVTAHNGAALTTTSSGLPSGYTSCNGVRFNRIWKVINTGNVTNVQLIFGNSSLPLKSNYTNLKLVIDNDGDGNFSNASTLISPSSFIGGIATFTNVTIPTEATFTLVFTEGYPGGIIQPTGIVNTAPISGTTTNNTNGLNYKLYSLNGTSGSIAAGFGAYNPVLLSSGYYHNATDFDDFVLNKINDNFGIELTGRLFITAPSAAYQFRANADDAFALIIDGTTVLDIATASSGTSLTVNLTGGYHDIIIRGRELGGAEQFNLLWNGGSGSNFVAIPEGNFYTQVYGPSAWFATDDNSLLTLSDATQLNTAGANTWNDLSINSNTLTTLTGNPTYFKETNLRNFNPVINFTDDVMTANYINAFSYGKQDRTMLGVSDMYATNAQENLTGYGRDVTNNNLFRLYKTSGNILTLEGISTSLPGVTSIFGTTRTTNIFTTNYSNGTLAGSNNNAFIYVDNALHIQGNRPAWNTTINDNENLAVGNSPDAATGNGWDGRFSEIIYYPWALSATERLKVNSYLAIKWGLTLSQTTPTNYIASDGSVIWNATTAANTYINDITSIGRDDCGALNQKQSTSTDGNDLVSIGIGGISTNNQSNSNTFSNNLSFLTIAHNNGDVTLLTNYSDIPSSLASCYTHFDRIWQVQTLNNPGPVTVAMGKKGLVVINASLYRPVLLVSNSTNFTNATVYNYTNYYLGVVTFENVNFANGQYFTMGYIPAGPGGVTTGLTTWFNSDYDVYTDVAQTTPAVNAGDTVRSINNLKSYAAFANVEEVTSSANPTYHPGSINYNAGVLFDGINDVLATSADISTLDYRTINQMTSIFAGYDIGTDPQNVYWYHDANVGGRKTSLERNQAFWSDDNTNSLKRNPTLTKPEIYSYCNTVGGSWRLYSNLATVGSGTTGNSNVTNTTGRFRIGNYSFGSTGTNAANFYLGEFAIYEDDKGSSTSAVMRRMHSYEAVKYGFTLDQTAMGGAYVASDGTTQTYNYPTHWNRITGIGRDDCSAFEQKQSKSSETGMMVKISNDPVNGIAATNKTNTASFTINKSFEIFGDDDKALIWTGIDKITDATFGNLIRLIRTWKVKETGTVGSVYLEVTGNGASGSDKLPAGPTTTSSVYLIVSNTANFKNPIAVKEMIPDTSPNATKWSTTYDFADGNYYTFATNIMCLAPTGNTEGLTSWYKVDNINTGTVLATTTGKLNDETGVNDLTRNNSGAATVTSGDATLFNYNKYLALTGGAALTKSGLTQASITSASEGSLFAVGQEQANLFGLSRNATDRFGFFLAPGNGLVYKSMNFGFGATQNNTIANTFGSRFRLNGSNWELTGSKNGSTLVPLTTVVSTTEGALTTASNYILGLGTYPAGGTFNNSGIAEAFSYNRALSVNEMMITNSYLALKYGQTLQHNYYSPNYDGTNGASATLYDVSSHGNRVFGVGNDIAGCFYQNQSTSALSGSMLKISADGAINNLNSQDKTVWIENQSYIIIGDNNGDVNTNGWITSSTAPVVHQPALYAYTNGCAKRISRQWKITTTGTNPAVLITVPGTTSTTSTIKLPAIPVNVANPNSLYMVINDNPDFAINANQSEVLMTLNATTGDYETTQTFAAGVTKYITFIYRPKVCRNCIITNSATSTTRKN